MGSGAGVVGRDQELETILAFLDEHERGGRLLLLEGDAGIGKTTLWRAGVEEATQRGYRVLRAAASRAETQLSFTTLRDLIDDVFDEVAEELPPPQRRALAVTLLREEPRGQPPEESVIAIALLTALRALAVRGPTLLAVDDVQWLDPASAVPLQHALHRLDPRGPSVLLSRRVEDDGELPLGLARLDDRQLRVVRIGALSAGALARIIRTRVGTTYPRPIVHRLHELSGGNPFFALELARALGRRGETRLVPGDLPLPSTLGELVREHLDALPHEAREALLLLCAASRPTTDLVRSVAGETGWAALAPAFEANVIERVGERLEFTHPLLGAAVYSEAGTARRREAHAVLARAVPDAEERARHLALAAEGADAAIASELEQAAQRLRRRGARIVCSELFDAAARLTPTEDGAGRARRQLAAAAALFEAGDSHGTRHMLEPLVAELPEGRERVEALWRLGTVLAETGSEHEAARLWREALDLARDPAAVADIRRSLALLAIYGGTAAEAAAHADHAVQAAEVSGDVERLAYALAVRAMAAVVAGDERYAWFVARALELESHVQALSSAWSPSAVAAECARLDLEVEEARARFRAVFEDAVEVGNAEIEQWGAYGLAFVELLAGRPDEAAGLAAVVADLAETTGVMRLPAARLRAEIDAHLGRVAEAETALLEVAEQALAGAESRYLWQARVALGGLALARGDSARAADEYRAARRLATELGFQHAAVMCPLVDEVEAALAADRLEQATEAFAAASALPRRTPLTEPLLGRAAAVRAASEGDLDLAEQLLRDVLALQAEVPLPVERGRTLLHLGAVRRRARKPTEARESLLAALATFEGAGASLWAERARAELRRVGGRGTGADELTPTELRIAELVAEGRTNREVAAALFVTVHTVEAALKRVYRKLDVRSRTELARKLAGPG